MVSWLRYVELFGRNVVRLLLMIFGVCLRCGLVRLVVRVVLLRLFVMY